MNWFKREQKPLYIPTLEVIPTKESLVSVREKSLIDMVESKDSRDFLTRTAREIMREQALGNRKLTSIYFPDTLKSKLYKQWWKAYMKHKGYNAVLECGEFPKLYW